MRLVDGLRRLDETVLPNRRWLDPDEAEPRPPRWARFVAANSLTTAVVTGVLLGALMALGWTLADYSFEFTNLATRTAILAPIAFAFTAVWASSVAERVRLLDRLERAETAAGLREVSEGSGE